jgi:hypothetical protein
MFLIMSRLILLSTRSISNKVTENTKHTFYVRFLLFFENRAVYEIKWQNIVQPDRPQMTTWRTRIACCIPKATNTHTEYVILIAFPLKQSLHERASMLRYMHIACLLNSLITARKTNY